MWTTIKKLEHVTNVLCVLNNKVQLHIKLSANQLQYLTSLVNAFITVSFHLPDEEQHQQPLCYELV